MRQVKVWDAAVRLFHWAIVLLIAAAWATQEFDRMDLHLICGYTILTLLIFRVIWGVVGSDTARFTRFLRSPIAAFEHLKHITRSEADREVGHNAAGGWMVLVMLLLIAVQTGAGLFAGAEDVEGPLKHLVTDDQTKLANRIHAINFTLIEIAIAMHVLAIIVYAVLKRQDLVRPMVLGSKSMPADTVAPRLASPILALVCLAAAAGAVAWIVTR